MKNLVLIPKLLVVSLVVTACEAPKDGSTLATPEATTTTSTAHPTSTIAPQSATPLVIAPVAPSISHIWATTNIPYDNPHSPGQANPQTPHTQLQGSYIGPLTNGPVYTLDFSHLIDGINHNVQIPVNSTHSCYYDLVLSTNFYNVNALTSCNDDTTGLRDNIHCEYCPYNNSGSYNNLNWIFDYSISNNQLTLIDSISGQSEIYSIKN